MSGKPCLIFRKSGQKRPQILREKKTRTAELFPEDHTCPIGGLTVVKHGGIEIGKPASGEEKHASLPQLQCNLTVWAAMASL